MQQLRADVFWYTKGKPYKFILEPLNFADDIVRSSNSQKKAVFKIWTDALFVNLDYSGWARPHLLLTISLGWW